MSVSDITALFNAARAAGVTSFKSSDCEFTLAVDFRPGSNPKGKPINRGALPTNAVDLAMRLSGMPEET